MRAMDRSVSVAGPMMYFAAERIAKAVRAAVQLQAASQRARIAEPDALQMEAFLAALVEDAVLALPADVFPANLRAALISGEVVGPCAAVWWPRVGAWFLCERRRLGIATSGFA